LLYVSAKSAGFRVILIILSRLPSLPRPPKKIFLISQKAAFVCGFFPLFPGNANDNPTYSLSGMVSQKSAYPKRKPVHFRIGGAFGKQPPS